jgi:hypothetical protein
MRRPPSTVSKDEEEPAAQLLLSAWQLLFQLLFQLRRNLRGYRSTFRPYRVQLIRIESERLQNRRRTHDAEGAFRSWSKANY